jgi:hypothetical protein
MSSLFRRVFLTFFAFLAVMVFIILSLDNVTLSATITLDLHSCYSAMLYCTAEQFENRNSFCLRETLSLKQSRICQLKKGVRKHVLITQFCLDN